MFFRAKKNVPFVRPLVRGKSGKPVECVAKLDISVSDRGTKPECRSFDAYNEITKLIETIARRKARKGHYSGRALEDKIYRIRKNFTCCEEHRIRLSGPALGRLKNMNSVTGSRPILIYFTIRPEHPG